MSDCMCPNFDPMKEELETLRAEVERLRADNARLREAVKDTLDELDEHVLDHDKVSQKTVTKRWQVEEAARLALASSDASQWLAERERRVAERVFAKCVGVAVSTGPCKEKHYQCELDQTVDAIVDALNAIDLAALLKEET